MEDIDYEPANDDDATSNEHENESDEDNEDDEGDGEGDADGDAAGGHGADADADNDADDGTDDDNSDTDAPPPPPPAGTVDKDGMYRPPQAAAAATSDDAAARASKQMMQAHQARLARIAAMEAAADASATASASSGKSKKAKHAASAAGVVVAAAAEAHTTAGMVASGHGDTATQAAEPALTTGRVTTTTAVAANSDATAAALLSPHEMLAKHPQPASMYLLTGDDEKALTLWFKVTQHVKPIITAFPRVMFGLTADMMTLESHAVTNFGPEGTSGTVLCVCNGHFGIFYAKKPSTTVMMVVMGRSGWIPFNPHEGGVTKDPYQYHMQRPGIIMFAAYVVLVRMALARLCKKKLEESSPLIGTDAFPVIMQDGTRASNAAVAPLVRMEHELAHQLQTEMDRRKDAGVATAATKKASAPPVPASGTASDAKEKKKSKKRRAAAEEAQAFPADNKNGNAPAGCDVDVGKAHSDPSPAAAAGPMGKDNDQLAVAKVVASVQGTGIQRDVHRVARHVSGRITLGPDLADILIPGMAEIMSAQTAHVTSTTLAITKLVSSICDRELKRMRAAYEGVDPDDGATLA